MNFCYKRMDRGGNSDDNDGNNYCTTPSRHSLNYEQVDRQPELIITTKSKIRKIDFASQIILNSKISNVANTLSFTFSWPKNGE